MLGYSVLLSDVDIVTLQNPFENLHRDVDVEGLSDGFDERSAYGWNDGIDDPSMAGGKLRRWGGWMVGASRVPTRWWKHSTSISYFRILMSQGQSTTEAAALHQSLIIH